MISWCHSANKILETINHLENMTSTILDSQDVNCLNSEQPLDHVRNALSSIPFNDSYMFLWPFLSLPIGCWSFVTYLYYRFIWWTLIILFTSSSEISFSTLSTGWTNVSKTNFYILMCRQDVNEAQKTISKNYTSPFPMVVCLYSTRFVIYWQIKQLQIAFSSTTIVQLKTYEQGLVWE